MYFPTWDKIVVPWPWSRAAYALTGDIDGKQVNQHDDARAIKKKERNQGI